MNVFVVSEGDNVVGVYSTKELADGRVCDICDERGWGDKYKKFMFTIQEWEVDGKEVVEPDEPVAAFRYRFNAYCHNRHPNEFFVDEHPPAVSNCTTCGEKFWV
jgi:hypothetical protein